MTEAHPTTQAKPKWGPEHDEIVRKYREAREQGRVKEFVVVPKG